MSVCVCMHVFFYSNFFYNFGRVRAIEREAIRNRRTACVASGVGRCLELYFRYDRTSYKILSLSRLSSDRRKNSTQRVSPLKQSYIIRMYVSTYVYITKRKVDLFELTYIFVYLNIYIHIQTQRFSKTSQNFVKSTNSSRTSSDRLSIIIFFF